MYQLGNRLGLVVQCLFLMGCNFFQSSMSVTQFSWMHYTGFEQPVLDNTNFVFSFFAIHVIQFLGTVFTINGLIIWIF